MYLRTCAGVAEPAIGDGWSSAAGDLVRCWCGAGWAPACDDPSLCGGRGVVAHPGAGACGGVGGDCARWGAGAGGAGQFVSSLGATACVICACGAPYRRAFVWDWDTERGIAFAG